LRSVFTNPYSCSIYEFCVFVACTAQEKKTLKKNVIESSQVENICGLPFTYAFSVKFADVFLRLVK
jgi:hypothetical protein